MKNDDNSPNIGDMAIKVANQLKYGVYTNTSVLNMLKHMKDITLEEVIGELIPQPLNSQYKNLEELLTRIARQQKMLKAKDTANEYR